MPQETSQPSKYKASSSPARAVISYPKQSIVKEMDNFKQITGISRSKLLEKLAQRFFELYPKETWNSEQIKKIFL